MTKIIIDKYLKNNTDLEEKKEIELSKEYEVLSKNTSLFAEICNEKNQDNQLIQINILSKSKNSIYYPRINYMRRSVGNKAARKSSPICSFACRRAYKRKYSSSSHSSNSSKELGKKKKRSNESKSSEKNEYEENESDNSGEEEDKESKSDENEDKENESGEEENKNNLVELMTSQDPIDGFWDKNKETIKIEKLLPKNIIDNINKICLNLKEKEKIFYTILIIFYLSTNFKDKVEEYKLVLNKAKKYLNKSGIIYDKIISQINNK